jgi:hypothetical protein
VDYLAPALLLLLFVWCVLKLGAMSEKRERKLRREK